MLSLIQSLQETHLNLILSDYIISQINPFETLNELQKISSELGWGDSVYIYNNTIGTGESIQYQLLEHFLRRFFPKITFTDSYTDNCIVIEVRDFNEQILIENEPFTSRRKEPIYFSMSELKIINDSDAVGKNEVLGQTIQSIKSLLYESLGDTGIIINATGGFINPLFNPIMLRFCDHMIVHHDVYSKQIVASLSWHQTQYFQLKNDVSVMRYLYGAGDCSIIGSTRNKLESLQWGNKVLVKHDKNYGAGGYLDIRCNPNAIMDQFFHEKGWILPLSVKSLLNPSFYDTDNIPQINSSVRSQILEFYRNNKKLSFESTIKVSMYQLIEKNEKKITVFFIGRVLFGVLDIIHYVATPSDPC